MGWDRGLSGTSERCPLTAWVLRGWCVGEDVLPVSVGTCGMTRTLMRPAPKLMVMARAVSLLPQHRHPEP